MSRALGLVTGSGVLSTMRLWKRLILGMRRCTPVLTSRRGSEFLVASLPVR